VIVLKEFEELCSRYVRESDARGKKLDMQFKMTMVTIVVGLIGVIYLMFN
jgi:hypothetical protein